MPLPTYADPELEARYDQFMELRETVNKALEEARAAKVIGKSFNAKLVLFPRGQVADLLGKLTLNLPQVFIVSQLEIRKDGYGSFKGEDISIDVLPAQGITCERCWQVVDHVDSDGLCDRCRSVVGK